MNISAAISKHAWRVDAVVDAEVLGTFNYSDIIVFGFGRSGDLGHTDILDSLEDELKQLIDFYGLHIDINDIEFKDHIEGKVTYLYSLRGKYSEISDSLVGAISDFRKTNEDSDMRLPTINPGDVNLDDNIDSMAKQAWKEEPVVTLNVTDAWTVSDIADRFSDELSEGVDMDVMEGFIEGTFITTITNQLKVVIAKYNIPVELLNVTFDELDSGNLSHAGAYFNFELRGRITDIIKLSRAINEYYDEHGIDGKIFLPYIEEDDMEGLVMEASLSKRELDATSGLTFSWRENPFIEVPYLDKSYLEMRMPKRFRKGSARGWLISYLYENGPTQLYKIWSDFVEFRGEDPKRLKKEHSWVWLSAENRYTDEGVRIKVSNRGPKYYQEVSARITDLMHNGYTINKGQTGMWELTDLGYQMYDASTESDWFIGSSILEYR